MCLALEQKTVFSMWLACSVLRDQTFDDAPLYL